MNCNQWLLIGAYLCEWLCSASFQSARFFYSSHLKKHCFQNTLKSLQQTRGWDCSYVTFSPVMWWVPLMQNTMCDFHARCLLRQSVSFSSTLCKAHQASEEINLIPSVMAVTLGSDKVVWQSYMLLRIFMLSVWRAFVMSLLRCKLVVW